MHHAKLQITIMLPTTLTHSKYQPLKRLPGNQLNRKQIEKHGEYAVYTLMIMYKIGN